MWLEALQAIALQRRTSVHALQSKNFPSQEDSKEDQSEILDEPVILKRKQSINHEKKSSSNNFLRFSLDFIPGQGKKYPTYDGGRQTRKSAFEISSVQSGDSFGSKVAESKDEKPSEKPKQTNSGLVNRRPNKPQKDRPISASVSDFLVLNDSTKKENEEQKAIPERRTTLLRPRLPTSFSVAKFLSHLEPKPGSNTPTSPWNAKRRISKSMNNLQVVENNGVILKQHKSASQLEIQIGANIEEPLISKNNETSNQVVPQLLDQQKEKANNPSEAYDEEVTPRDKKKEKKINITRRRSSLAVIKQFFFPSKKTTKDKSPDPSHSPMPQLTEEAEKPLSKLDVEDTTEASIDIESQIFKDKDMGSNIEEKNTPELKSTSSGKGYLASKGEQLGKRERQTCLSQISESGLSVQEEPFTADKSYECDVKVIEIVEPEPCPKINEDNPQPSIILPEISESKQSPESFSNKQFNYNDWQTTELRPPLPIKTKSKCPSPDYDVPRSASVSSASSLKFVTDDEQSFIEKAECVHKVELNKIDSLDYHECQPLEPNVELLQSLEKFAEDDQTSSEKNYLQEIGNTNTETIERSDKSDEQLTSVITACQQLEPEPPKSKPINVSSGLSHLVHFFNNDSGTKQTLNVTRRSKTEGAANRLSFASTETEMVVEEEVEVLGLDSKK